MAIKAKPLPYDIKALRPHISWRTLDLHYNKHYLGYVDKLNNLTEGTIFEEMRLIDMVSINDPDNPIYNNAAQAWNHTFFWYCLTPNEESASKLSQLNNFGEDFNIDIDKTRAEFMQKANSLFGSGWVWWVWNPKTKNIEVIQGKNAYNPIVDHKRPLFVCDVWEHAYYLDYQNDRAAYLDNIWQVINWSFVFNNIKKATFYAKS